MLYTNMNALTSKVFFKNFSKLKSKVWFQISPGWPNPLEEWSENSQTNTLADRTSSLIVLMLFLFILKYIQCRKLLHFCRSETWDGFCSIPLKAPVFTFVFSSQAPLFSLIFLSMYSHMQTFEHPQSIKCFAYYICLQVNTLSTGNTSIWHFSLQVFVLNYIYLLSLLYWEKI